MRAPLRDKLKKNCSYEATTKESLPCYQKAVYECIKYPFKHCSYEATREEHLVSHQEAVHEGIKNPCKHCSYDAARK